MRFGEMVDDRLADYLCMLALRPSAPLSACWPLPETSHSIVLADAVVANAHCRGGVDNWLYLAQVGRPQSYHFDFSGIQTTQARTFVREAIRQPDR